MDTKKKLSGSCKSNASNPQDYFNPEKIVTWVGTSKRKVDTDGTVTISDNGTYIDRRLEATKASMTQKSLVTVILGQKYTQEKLQLPVEYKFVGIGLYQVEDLWAEQARGETIIWKILLQRHDLQNKPCYWSTSPNPPPLTERNFEYRVPNLQCENCEQSSPQRYSDMWLCANEKCARYWTNGDVAPSDSISASLYKPYLQQLFTPDGWTKPVHPLFPYDLVDVLKNMSQGDLQKPDTLRLLWAGTVCPKCTRCTMRIGWLNWECGNPDCHYIFDCPVPYKDLSSVIDDLDNYEQGFPASTGKVLRTDFGLSTTRTYNTTSSGDEYVKDVLHLPQDPITKQMPKVITINYNLDKKAMSGQADELFDSIQKEPAKREGSQLAFQRARSKKDDLGHRSRHFGFENIGLDDSASPYDYGCVNAKASLQNACDPVKKIMAILTHEAQEHGEIPFAACNEALTLLYLTDMACDWHTDGDHGMVGSVHLSYSLGSTGKLDLKMTEGHYQNKSADDVHLPGSLYGREFAAFKAELEQGICTLAEYAEKKKQFRKENPRGVGKKAPTIASVMHYHGQITIFVGSALQDYYMVRLHVAIP